MTCGERNIRKLVVTVKFASVELLFVSICFMSKPTGMFVLQRLNLKNYLHNSYLVITWANYKQIQVCIRCVRFSGTVLVYCGFTYVQFTFKLIFWIFVSWQCSFLDIFLVQNFFPSKLGDLGNKWLKDLWSRFYSLFVGKMSCG